MTEAVPTRIASWHPCRRCVEDAASSAAFPIACALAWPGGIGKIRLALAIAAQIGADFADGIRFEALGNRVDLARDQQFMSERPGHAGGGEPN